MDEDGKNEVGTAIVGEVADAAAEHLKSTLRETVGEFADAVPGGRIAIAIAKVVAGPSADARLARAEDEADRDAALMVPALRRDFDAIQRLVDRLRQQVSDVIGERTNASGRELIDAAGKAGVPVDELQQNPHAMQALIKGWRAMLDAEAEEALPLLAKLAIRYRDRVNDPQFRSLSRVLVDAAAEDLDALRAIVAASTHLLLENLSRPNPIPGAPSRGIFFIAYTISEGDRREAVELHQWQDDYGGPPIVSRDDYVMARHGIVASLLRHGVLIDPPRTGVAQLFYPGTQQEHLFAELELSTLQVLKEILTC